jgi:hypothetical protein
MTNRYIIVSVTNFLYPNVNRRRKRLQTGAASERVGMIGYDSKKVVNYQDYYN